MSEEPPNHNMGENEDDDDVQDVMDVFRELGAIPSAPLVVEDPRQAMLAAAEDRLAALTRKQTELEQRAASMTARITRLRMGHVVAHVASELTSATEFGLGVSPQRVSRSLPPSSVISSTRSPPPVPSNIPAGIVLPTEPDEEVIVKDEIVKDHSSVATLQEKQSANDSFGNMENNLRHLIQNYDSDATESSSGGESCDEADSVHGVSGSEGPRVPISKRATWGWLARRARLSSRWSWLTAQVADIEYNIRKNNELYKQIRIAKGAVTLDEPLPTHMPNGSHVDLNRGPEEDFTPSSCSRTRPVKPLRKRRIMRTKDLFRTFVRAAKPSSVRCQCAQSVYWCTICMGNVYHTQLPDPSSQERRHCLALLDSSYHQVLSNKEEEPLSARILQKLLDRSWQIETLNRSHNITGICDLLASEMPSGDAEGEGGDAADIKEKDSEVERKRRLALRRRRERDRRRKRLRLKAFADQHGQLLRRKLSVHHYSDGNETAMHDLSTLDDGSSYESANDMATPSPSLLSKQAWAELIRRRRETSFDIDNIIIPQSLMASTRVEKLKYKEILTPSWRLVNGAGLGIDGLPALELDEDVADSSYRFRHAQAEVEERRRWHSSVTSSGAQRGSRVTRRRDSNNCLEDAILSGGNTPDPLSPAPCAFSVDPEDSCTRPSTPANSSAADDSTSSRPRSSSFLQSSIADDSSNPPSAAPGAPPTHRFDTPSFELRSFPLAEDDVSAMEAEMPEEYLQICRRESQDGSATPRSDAAAE